MSVLLTKPSNLHCLLFLILSNALILLVNGYCPNVFVEIDDVERELNSYRTDENVYDDEDGKMSKIRMLST